MLKTTSAGPEREGSVRRAIPILQKAMELDPKNADAHNNLGWALNGKGQYDEPSPSSKRPSNSTRRTLLPTTTSAGR